MKQQCQICKKWFSRIVHHLNRSKCIEIAKKKVSLVPIYAMNTFAAVPSDDDANGSTNNYLNDLEKILLLTTIVKQQFWKKMQAWMMLMVILKIICMIPMTMTSHMIILPIRSCMARHKRLFQKNLLLLKVFLTIITAILHMFWNAWKMNWMKKQ